MQKDLFEYILALGDDRLVLGHRLSEWCGHAPVLEEDIALANIALDLIGQATAFLKFAGEIEAAGRDQDALAYFRDEFEYRNFLLCELPRGDFGFTIARLFLFSVYSLHLFDQLQRSSNAELAAISAKSLKEVRYHVRHASEWMLRLGDGTEESHRRVQDGLDKVAPYLSEIFEMAPQNSDLLKSGIGADLNLVRTNWDNTVKDILSRAKLSLPASAEFQVKGGRIGKHTEHLGHMLSEMQIVARSHPGAAW